MIPSITRVCHRFYSNTTVNSFKFERLRVTLCSKESRKPKPETLRFGKDFSDHLLMIKWSQSNGWSDPEIRPFQDLALHPASKVLHYSQNVFEGMKAFRGHDNKIRLFRPEMNMNRLLTSAERGCLATFDPEELLKCLKKFIQVEKDWVPKQEFTSLYLRPTYIGVEPSLGVSSSLDSLLYIIASPVGTFFGGKIKPISLYANPAYVRAWPGGAGAHKLSANYGPTLAVQRLAEEKGFQQVLWLFGDDHQLTEAGVLNIFVYMIDKNGNKELVTPPLEQNLILPGITRDSVLTLARDWNEFKVTERRITMDELLLASKENRLIEMFGCGTAFIVSPIGRINYQGKDYIIPTKEGPDSINGRVLRTLIDIQSGKKSYKDWTQVVC